MGFHKSNQIGSRAKNIKFGIIGGGTSNGLAMSILHSSHESYGEIESTFLICKGQSSPIDLSYYETRSTSYASFLTFSWGLIADVDLESEFLRFLGVLRNDVWAVWRTVTWRSYNGNLSYLPLSASIDRENPHYRDNQNEHDNNNNVLVSVLPPMDDDTLPESWVTIEGGFKMIWACQVSHPASNTFASPNSKLNDGIFKILVVREPATRLEMLKMFLEIETGGHIRHSACETYDCKAFRLDPAYGAGSYNDLDGEEIESGRVQGKVLPAATRVFCGGLA